MTSRSWLLAVFLLAGMATTRDATAAPKDQKQCADAYLEAQKTRKAGSLVAAKKQLEICAASRCLAAVRNECSQWMTEVDGELPSVVVKFAGPNVTLTIDGAGYSGALDAAIPLDPGSHVLVFTRQGGATVKREVILKSGDKSVTIEAFPPPPEPTPEPVVPPPEPPRRSLLLPIVLGSVGAVALGGMTVFWLKGQSKEHALDTAACAPDCTDKSVGIIRRDRILGDVALGVAVVSLGAAAYLFFTRPHSNAAKKGELWPFVF